MEAALRGGDRQALHERLRGYSFEAQEAVARGGDNPLIDRVLGDADFRLERDEVLSWLDPNGFTGRSAEQVDAFLRDHARPAIAEIETVAADGPRV